MDKSALRWLIRAMLRRTYNWCTAAADKPYALWILAAVAFAESSFFPVPPDVMLLPMALARPNKGLAVCDRVHDRVGCRRRAWLCDRRIALRLGRPMAHHLYGLGDKVEAFRASYAEWGALIILVKGLTPIPYKLVTITRVSPDTTSGCSSCARSSRAAAGSSWSRSCSTATAMPSGTKWKSGSALWVAIGAVVLVFGFYIAFRLV